jgi:four helix bundle protein
MMNGNKFVFPFEKLDIWQLSIEFAEFVLDSMATFPPNRFLRLIGQMEAAVASISQNIVEGKGRQYKKEFIQHLYIAEGSLFEVLTLAEIFYRRGLINDNISREIKLKAEIIDRKLHGLINTLKSAKQKPCFT